jgi:hypothetical protein
MKIKKIISITLLSAMMLSNFTFADGLYKESIPFTQENVEKNEVYENKNEDIYISNEAFGTRSVEPGDEAVQVVTTNLWTTGNTYEGTSKQSSTLSNLFTTSFTVAGYYLNSGLNIIKDVSYISLNLQWNEVALSSPGVIKVSHSYSYTSRLGQVYNAATRNWNTKVDIEKRYIYAHEYASFKSTDGLTRTGTYDKLDSPIATEAKAYYNDTNWIIDRTYAIHNSTSFPYVDAWTH